VSSWAHVAAVSTKLAGIFQGMHLPLLGFIELQDLESCLLVRIQRVGCPEHLPICEGQAWTLDQPLGMSAFAKPLTSLPATLCIPSPPPPPQNTQVTTCHSWCWVHCLTRASLGTAHPLQTPHHPSLTASFLHTPPPDTQVTTCHSWCWVHCLTRA
jgi:hypothetical protein